MCDCRVKARAAGRTRLGLGLGRLGWRVWDVSSNEYYGVWTNMILQFGRSPCVLQMRCTVRVRCLKYSRLRKCGANWKDVTAKGCGLKKKVGPPVLALVVYHFLFDISICYAVALET